jgi:hypothetical protein
MQRQAIGTLATKVAKYSTATQQPTLLRAFKEQKERAQKQGWAVC